MFLLQNLCGGIALTCGGPNRTPEHALVTICVLEDGERVLCYGNDTLFLKMHYSKHRSNKGTDDLTPKALCRRMAKLVLQYTTFVVPVCRTFAPIRFGKDCRSQLENYRDYLFVRSGVRYTGDNVTHAIESVTAKYCGGKICVSELRHIVKSILLYVIGENPDSIREAMADSEEDDPVNAVFGHSDAVGRREYAVLEGSAPTTNVPYFNRLMEVAYKLHAFYGVGEAQVTVQPRGRLTCAPSERGVVSSLISVRQFTRRCTYVSDHDLILL